MLHPTLKACQQWHLKAKALGFLDKNDKPMWKKQVTYYWTETFPAKQTIAVTHDYSPQVGSGAGFTPKADITQYDHYASDKAWAEKTKPDTHHYHLNSFENVQYILTTGANWSGPIEKFTLNIKYDPKDMIIFNHFYGNDKAHIVQTPGETKILLTHFTPKQDLDILFDTWDSHPI